MSKRDALKPKVYINDNRSIINIDCDSRTVNKEIECVSTCQYCE